MAKYQSPTTTTVSSSSVSIFSGTDRDVVEVAATDAAIWVHVEGGTASASGANCIPVPQDSAVEIHLSSGVSSLTAIRAGSTDAEVTVSKLAGG